MNWKKQRPSVFVIDDQPMNSQMVADILMGSICDLKCFSDPHEGLREIMVAKPDLVLLDLDMPGLSGMEILQQLRHMRSTQHQQVIMFTAHSDPDTVKAILDMKVSDYLIKPFKAGDLIRKLTQVLGRDLFP
jgi:DNA-binding response OmpR family regulator